MFQLKQHGHGSRKYWCTWLILKRVRYSALSKVIIFGNLFLLQAKRILKRKTSPMFALCLDSRPPTPSFSTGDSQHSLRCVLHHSKRVRILKLYGVTRLAWIIHFVPKYRAAELVLSMNTDILYNWTVDGTVKSNNFFLEKPISV